MIHFMEKPEIRNLLSSKVTSLIEEFKKISDGEIKQNTLAKLLGISEAALAKAKAPYYKVRLNTLKDLIKDLEELLKEYKESPEKVLAILENKDDREPKLLQSNTKGRRIVYGVVIIIALFVIGIFYFAVINEPILVEKFETHFNNIDPDELLDGEYNGWKVYNIDSSYLLKQHSEKALTLHSIAGDYWNIPGTKDVVNNIFVRELHCESCLIELKLFGFYPNRFRQNVGMFIFQEKNGSFDSENFVSLTAGSGDHSGNDGSLGINISGILNGEARYHVEQPRINYPDPSKKHSIIPLDTVYLYLHINSKSQLITSQYRRQSEWARRERIKETGIEHPYKPRYLGIGGFQITQHDRGEPVDRDTIPVYIDRIRVMDLH